MLHLPDQLVAGGHLQLRVLPNNLIRATYISVTTGFHRAGYTDRNGTSAWRPPMGRPRIRRRFQSMTLASASPTALFGGQTTSRSDYGIGSQGQFSTRVIASS